jgi:hypothetical protein
VLAVIVVVAGIGFAIFTADAADDRAEIEEAAGDGIALVGALIGIGVGWRRRQAGSSGVDTVLVAAVVTAVAGTLTALDVREVGPDVIELLGLGLGVGAGLMVLLTAVRGPLPVTDHPPEVDGGLRDQG